VDGDMIVIFLTNPRSEACTQYVGRREYCRFELAPYHIKRPGTFYNM